MAKVYRNICSKCRKTFPTGCGEHDMIEFPCADNCGKVTNSEKVAKSFKRVCGLYEYNLKTHQLPLLKPDSKSFWVCGCKYGKRD